MRELKRSIAKARMKEYGFNKRYFWRYWRKWATLEPLAVKIRNRMNKRRGRIMEKIIRKDGKN